MTRPLSDLVPLRDTRAWDGYDSIEIIPRVYGRARVKPLRYNDAGTLYVLADHPIAGVVSVTLDGDPTDGFAWRNGADSTGHAVAYLELASAPDTSASLAAEIDGLDGNPASIIADLYPRSDLQDLGIYCRNANLALGGALVEKITLRAAIQFVCEQIGMVWSAGLPGFAAPFPPASTDPDWAALGPIDLSDWSAETGLADLITRLNVSFDWDRAADKARQSVVLEATAATAEHGLRESDLALPWVKTARQAVATATAYLQWRARPLWTLQATIGTQHRDLQPGCWVTVQHPRIPLAGRYVVTDIDPGYGKGAVTLTAQAPAGLVPAVSIIQQSAAFDPISTDYSVSAGGDNVTLTITDEAGQKLPGAKVWIDGKGPQTADSAAKVRFLAVAGKHVLRIEADGKTAITTSITLPASIKL